jgi:receptor protein-tyrosine kinase
MSSDGKTTIASNLAYVIAQTQKSVIFLDGDLRNSSIQAKLDLGDKPGLSSVLSGFADVSSVFLPMGDASEISMIPAGPLPPNPTELVNSPQMHQLFEKLSERADIVIVDGPPFIVTDAAILSEQVDGIIIVVRVGHTHRDAIKAMMNQVNMLSTPILGIVLNRHHDKPSYYSAYYHQSERKPTRRFFFF